MSITYFFSVKPQNVKLIHINLLVTFILVSAGAPQLGQFVRKISKIALKIQKTLLNWRMSGKIWSNVGKIQAVLHLHGSLTTRFSKQHGFLNNTVYSGTLICPFSTKSLLHLHGFLLTRLFFSVSRGPPVYIQYLYFRISFIDTS